RGVCRYPLHYRLEPVDAVVDVLSRDRRLGLESVGEVRRNDLVRLSHVDCVWRRAECTVRSERHYLFLTRYPLPPIAALLARPHPPVVAVTLDERSNLKLAEDAAMLW